jgi:uncharacterized protein
MQASKRIQSLDLLRGVAVLGILVMNIQSFSMPMVAYINPTAYGDLNGLNRWVWILSHILASQKFMSIFSMLFGAGVWIFTRNATARGLNSAALHYRRMLWLVVFGLLHGYLLWYGDILFTYALCGMLLYLFRNLSARKLIWTGCVFFLVPLIVNSLMVLSMPYWPEEALRTTMESWKMDPALLQHYLEAYRGNWMEQMKVRIPAALFMQTRWFFMQAFWRVLSMMLLGMALFKGEILSAGRSHRWYVKLVLAGLVPGILLSTAGVVLNFRKQWSMEYSMFLGTQFNYVGSVGTALGYVGLVMLVSKSSSLKGIRQVISGVGRMAFSNYILMTLIATYVFYGHGFGLFGKVERTYQALLVAGIWILILIFSSLWLNRLRMGPLEALWRRLTYGRWPPLKK